jgi:hypothetical protein
LKILPYLADPVAINVPEREATVAGVGVRLAAGVEAIVGIGVKVGVGVGFEFELTAPKEFIVGATVAFLGEEFCLPKK